MSSIKTTFWHNKYVDRYLWAYKTYDQFIQNLEPEVAAEFRRKDQITVVLYGHTQAGKTTVLLTLLGIEDQYLTRVSNVLRGGRPKGNSATSTATFYTKSNSKTWSLDDQKNLSDEEMLNRLGTIRDKVMHGTLQDTRSIHIEIPDCYFHPTRFDNVGFQIIDLPGTCCENAKERELVAEIAKTYIPYADMVLIVNNMTKQTLLQPENMVLDPLKTWYIFPEKFHLVLTQSFSPDSIQRMFKDNSLSEDDIRRETLQQLQHTLGANFPTGTDHLCHFFYPVECGDSWNFLKTSSPEYFKKVKPVRNKFLDLLTDDIINSATPLGRVRMAGRAKPIAEHQRQMRLEEYKSEEEIIQRALRSIKSREKRNQKIRDSLQCKIEEIETNLSKLAAQVPSQSSEEIPATPPYNEEKKVENIYAYIDAENKKLETAWDKFYRCAQGIGEKIDLYSPKLPVDENKLGGLRFLNKCYVKWRKGYQKDCDMVGTAAKQAWKAIRSKIGDAYRSINGKLGAKRKQMESAKSRCDDRLRTYTKEITSIRKELTNLDNKRKKYLDRINPTIAEADGFYRTLNDAWSEYIKNEIENLQNLKKPDEQFLQLCYLKLLHKTRKEILTDGT